MNAKITKSCMPELLALCLLTIGYCVISFYHEPWFDEAQAWQIAKCASVWDVLFEIPHYEGHPPLWHLILMIPAKLGMPFEMGLKGVGCLVFIATVALILFKSPFPRPVRPLLPLSYFVFYQYGIIVRPYCLMLLAFLLLAWQYPAKDSHPWRYVGLLLLLCLTSAFGMVFAAGIALCMSWELVREKGIAGLFRDLLRDARTRSLLVLLILAILLVIEIFPRPDTMVTSMGGKNPFFVCLLCSLFTFFGECLLHASSWFAMDRVLLQQVAVPWYELAVLALLGFLVWFLLVLISSKKNLKYLVVPYVLFAFTAAVLYFSVHHVGLALLFLLFWLWIATNDQQRGENGNVLLVRMDVTQRDKKLCKALACTVIVCALVIPLYWTISASIHDVRLEYSYGRDTSQFFESRGLGDSRIFASLESAAFKHVYPGLEDTGYVNTNEVGIPVLTCAYMGKNICYNLNGGRDAEAYMHFRYPTQEQSLQTMQTWRDEGLPDVIFGYKTDIGKVLGDDFPTDDYAVAFVFELNSIWKNSYKHSEFPIFVRKDLLQEHGLQELERKYSLWYDGLEITEEMRAQYEAGVPVEDIVAPYLDEMLGDLGK